ncbi:hypothetical protein mRhiFer1_008248 [Rhinolophus ferrumequinum]|uniref:Uncharacterized protein n=1 Tax=Rhinolophus ferrumequinum TaxID=59479 RepID=A0A7J7VQM1_RHIFE|nr:hypothetical protein mRhiFer1_008248 [Rhinolophus ferrumequinum]
MRRSHGKPTVLDCMLKNFRKGFRGTLDLPTICRVYIVVTGTPEHPDQFPYIDSWLEIARTLPPWVQFCSNSKGQSMVLIAWNPRGHAQKDMTKTIYQGDPNKEPPPPPYAPRPTAGATPLLPDTALPASASPWSQPNQPGARLHRISRNQVRLKRTGLVRTGPP